MEDGGERSEGGGGGGGRRRSQRCDGQRDEDDGLTDATRQARGINLLTLNVHFMFDIAAQPLSHRRTRGLTSIPHTATFSLTPGGSLTSLNDLNMAVSGLEHPEKVHAERFWSERDLNPC